MNFCFVFFIYKSIYTSPNVYLDQKKYMYNHKHHRFLAWLSTPESFTINEETLRIATLVPEETQHAPAVSISNLMQNIFRYGIPTQTSISLPDQTLHVRKGIHAHTPIIVIFSRGYAKKTRPNNMVHFIQKGGGISGAYNLYRDKIINTIACITFDYPDERTFFNFGQATDYSCLKYVYTKVHTAYPNARIIIVGDCRGAKVALDFATENPQNLAGLILFSPFFSAQNITKQLAKNYLWFIPLKEKILHTFFKSYYPNYCPKEKNIFDNLSAIHADLPIFIGHRMNDTLVSNEEMYHFANMLKQTGHTNVHFTIVHDQSVPHSRLTPHSEIQQALQAFFQIYSLAV